MPFSLSRKTYGPPRHQTLCRKKLTNIVATVKHSPGRVHCTSPPDSKAEPDNTLIILVLSVPASEHGHMSSLCCGLNSRHSTITSPVHTSIPQIPIPFAGDFLINSFHRPAPPSCPTHSLHTQTGSAASLIQLHPLAAFSSIM